MNLLIQKETLLNCASEKRGAFGVFFPTTWTRKEPHNLPFQTGSGPGSIYINPEQKRIFIGFIGTWLPHEEQALLALFPYAKEENVCEEEFEYLLDLFEDPM